MFKLILQLHYLFFISVSSLQHSSVRLQLSNISPGILSISSRSAGIPEYASSFTRSSCVYDKKYLQFYQYRHGWTRNSSLLQRASIKGVSPVRSRSPARSSYQKSKQRRNQKPNKTSETACHNRIHLMILSRALRIACSSLWRGRCTVENNFTIRCELARVCSIHA